MQAVILAGGLATRMGDLCKTTPKCMLPIGGRPFLEWPMIELAREGCSEVVLCLGHLEAPIREYFSPYWMGMSVRISISPHPGILNALKCALPLLRDRFLVTYGDSLLLDSYAAPWSTQNVGPRGAMYVSRKMHGNVSLVCNRTVYFPGKGEYVDHGAFAIRKSALEDSYTEADLKTGLNPIFAQQAVHEIGTPNAYYALKERFKVWE